ncbi:MAG: DMT family transporter [Bacteroidota bacterium]
MKATLVLIVAAACWGLNFHFATYMLQEVSFVEAAFWRYAVSGLSLLLIALPTLRQLRWHTVSRKGVLLVGTIGVFAFNLFFFLGLRYTSPINAALIVALNPVTTLFASALILKTPIRRYQMLGAAISLAGVALLLVKGDLGALATFQLNKGDLFIFLANLVFAFQNVWVKQYKGALSNVHFTLLTQGVSLVCFAIALAFTSAPTPLAYTGPFWVSALGIGVLGTTVAYLSWNQGITLIGADRAGIFINLVPLSTALSAIFLQQTLYPYHAYTGALILLGIVVSQVPKLIQAQRVG